MGFKSPPALKEDSDVLDVLARILASGKGSRLYRRCTDQGLTSDVFGINFRLRDPGLFSVFAYLAPDQTHETVEGAVTETIEEIQADGVAQEELDRARSQLRAQIAFDRDGPMRVASQLNEALAAGDWKLYTQYLDRLDQITVEDIQRVARKYLVREKSTTGWYVPRET
jgi:zinc protease